jgi:hypothetical protein
MHQPSAAPIHAPTATPTHALSTAPTKEPTAYPSTQPTVYPTPEPTKYPTTRDTAVARPTPSPSACTHDCSDSQYRYWRECKDRTICQDNQYQSTAPTCSSDRGCTRLTECRDGIGGQFESIPPTTTSDRGCAAAGHCDLTKEYESTPPTSTSATQCTELSPRCQQGAQFEAERPTATSDRVCENLRVCDSKTEYDAGRMTTGPRVGDCHCALLTQCGGDLEYESLPPTATSDRVCTKEIVCDPATQDKVGTGANARCRSKRRRQPRQLRGDQEQDNGTESYWYGCIIVKQYLAEGNPYDHADAARPVCNGVVSCHIRWQFEVTPPTSTSTIACASVWRCAIRTQNTRMGQTR